MLPAGSPCDRWRSRTVPTNATTPPTPASPARSEATSAPRSKSAVWITTRGACVATSIATSPPGDRWKERKLCTVLQRRRVVAQHLVQRGAQRLAPRQRARMSPASRDQRVANARDGRPFGDVERLSGPERLADRREITNLDLHRPSHSANER